MMLTSSPRQNALKVALATTHLPLRDVADAITPKVLDEVLAILKRALVRDFGIAHPVIAVAGLNPHAGESGHMGREEIEVITPRSNEQRHRDLILLARFLPIPSSFPAKWNVGTQFSACTMIRDFPF